ncbi:MAG: ABC transporter permease [Isosphaeraceae bacterium]
MLMGPVFRAEMLRTSRQKRYYFLRVVYGLLLLAIVWAGYAEMQRIHRGEEINTRMLASFAAQVFMGFAIVQLTTVLLLVPPIFGGAIADEKQRKTLHYIMASQLSSFEIVLDKVLGRASLLWVFVAIGLPIVSILSLSGGISAEMLIAAYGGTVSTVFFAVALTVLVSTWARRVRDAVMTSYLLLLFWMFVPPLVMLIGREIRPRLYDFVEPVNDWLVDLAPLGAFLRLSRIPGLVPAAPEDEFLLMVGLQLGATALLLLLAIWRLRPIFRRQEETPARRTWFKRSEKKTQKVANRRHWFDHPPCGDDPIAWKERWFAPVDRFTQLVLLPAIIVITLPLALLTEADGRISSVFVDLARNPVASFRSPRSEFLRAIQIDVGWYVGFWLLAVAGAAASSVTLEREKDTWVSLTASPLTGWEILRGKLLGALWNQRGFAAVLIFLWLLGLVTGTVNPLGMLASILAVAVLTWFVAAVGAYFSLKHFSTTRALASTLLALAICNGYPLFLLVYFSNGLSWNTSFSVLGVMPSLASWCLALPRSANSAWASIWHYPVEGLQYPVLPFFVFGGYAAGAAVMTLWIALRFDRWLDRPPLSGPSESDEILISKSRSEPELEKAAVG